MINREYFGRIIIKCIRVWADFNRFHVQRWRFCVFCACLMGKNVGDDEEKKYLCLRK